MKVYIVITNRMSYGIGETVTHAALSVPSAFESMSVISIDIPEEKWSVWECLASVRVDDHGRIHAPKGSKISQSHSRTVEKDIENLFNLRGRLNVVS